MARQEPAANNTIVTALLERLDFDENRLASMWLLGSLSEEERESLRSEAQRLGLTELVNDLDRPDQREAYLRLLEAAGFVVAGPVLSPHTPSSATRDELFHWLGQNFGIVPPELNRGEEMDRAIDHIVGSEAKQHFAELEATFHAFRERLHADCNTAADRVVLGDFPELVAADSDPQLAISYPLYAWRRLVWYVDAHMGDDTPADRRWSVSEGILALQRLDLPEDRLTEFMALIPNVLSATPGPVPSKTDDKDDIIDVTMVTLNSRMEELAQEDPTAFWDELRHLGVLNEIMLEVGLADTDTARYFRQILATPTNVGERLMDVLRTALAVVAGAAAAETMTDEKVKEIVERVVVQRGLLKNMTSSECPPELREFIAAAHRGQVSTIQQLEHFSPQFEAGGKYTRAVSNTPGKNRANVDTLNRGRNELNRKFRSQRDQVFSGLTAQAC